MTDTATLPPLRPADQIHFHETVIWHLDGPDTHRAIPRTIATRRAQTVTLTADSLAADRALLDLIDDPEAQVAKWGKVMAGRGPFPADAPRFHPGSPEADAERDRRLRDALRIADPSKRKKVRDSIFREFGHPNASVQLSETIGSDGRWRDGSTPDERRRARWEEDHHG